MALTNDFINRIGFWVGVLAFLLAVPLSILANLLTPKVHTWWSSRSAQTRKRELDRLEALLGEANASSRFTDAETQLFEIADFIFALISLTVQMAYGLFFFLLGSFAKALVPTYISVKEFGVIFVVFSLGGIFNLLLTRKFSNRIGKARQLHTMRGRENLAKQIEKLKGAEI